MIKAPRKWVEEKSNFLNQPCPMCGTIHDYELRGRTVECTCGSKLRENPKKRHQLVRAY